MKHSCSIALLLLTKLSLHFVDCWIASSKSKTLIRHGPSSRLTRSSSSSGDVWEIDDKAHQPNSSIISVNYHISRQCNYHCKFCFHTHTNSNKLSLEEAKKGLRLLQQAGMKKVNFAGGEPFLHPHMLGELCRTSQEELGLAVSIISNGSLITSQWMQEYGQFVDILGVSVDSFIPSINALIGRGGDANNQHIERVLNVRHLCSQHDILFKMNTVVCALNWQEDMNEQILNLDPYRWKAFQVLLLNGENTGKEGELRDANLIQITPYQFDCFLERHNSQSMLVAEPNDVMRDSYLIMDEELRFLDCSEGGKVPTQSILNVGVGKALEQLNEGKIGFDSDMFRKRGGIYDWKKGC